jgi:hypothetical protein
MWNVGVVGGGSIQKNPRRAQKLITTLLTDLDHLEVLYKNEEFKSMEIVTKLQNENADVTQNKTKQTIL